LLKVNKRYRKINFFTTSALLNCIIWANRSIHFFLLSFPCKQEAKGFGSGFSTSRRPGGVYPAL
jgi:hypothetical protein